MPEQILRYSSTRSISHAIAFNEKSKNLLKNIENTQKCPNCDSKVKFELQIFPNLQNDLIEDESKDGEFLKTGMPDFGSVYVFTCGRDCWDEENDEFRLEVAPMVVVDSLK